MSGKGYYIALILCAAAIGISGYLYYRNANQEESMSKDPSSYQNPQEGTVPAVATRPGTEATEPSTTNPTQPTEKPEPLKTGAPVSGHDVIFLGFPVWWYVAPTILNTFLEAYDFTGKTIVLFATSGGSGLGKSADGLRPSAPGAKIMDGRMLNGHLNEAELSAWAEGLKL